MVTSIAGHDLLPASESTCHADGTFIGLSPAGRENEPIDIARNELGQQVREPSARRRHGQAAVHKRELTELLRHSFLYPRRYCVAQVGAYCLAGPVQVLLAVVAVEVHTFGAFD